MICIVLIISVFYPVVSSLWMKWNRMLGVKGKQ